MRTLVILVCMFLGCEAFAQPPAVLKIAEKISEENLRKSVYYLASEKLGGRFMGSHGDTLASEFIADSFKKNAVLPVFDGRSYFQSVVGKQNFPVKELLTIDGKSYHRHDGWILTENQSVQYDGPVVFIGYGLTDDRYDDFRNVDVKGKVVLVMYGRPKFKKQIDFKSYRMAEKLQTLKSRGVVAALSYDSYFDEDVEQNRQNDNKIGFVSKKPSVPPVLPFMVLSRERTNQLLATDDLTIQALEDSINKSEKPHSFILKKKIGIDVKLEWRDVVGPNVVGTIPGIDPGSEYVIVSAHHDHLGIVNGKFYPGACDDASGTAALMEMASSMALAAKSGQRPKRTTVFLSTTGEEGGNLGAFWYLDYPALKNQKVFADINLDILGRVGDPDKDKPDSLGFVYILQKDTLKSIFTSAIMAANAASVKLRINKNYNKQSPEGPLETMDTFPFLLRGIPCVSFFSGLTKDALKPTETPDKVNYSLLTKQTKLAFLTLWNIANQ